MANRYDSASGTGIGIPFGVLVRMAAVAASTLIGVVVLSPLGAGHAALAALGAALVLAFGHRLRPAAAFAADHPVKVDGGAGPPVASRARCPTPRRPMVLDGGSLGRGLRG
ncbi:hypothetical protein Thimo_0220 [Thioflavicoccus mobilis 8321]|uniref:Uncharacterized protein n=1 Tax=Thioflavicoccus mobilis 8321 TaxID=765912 RepID=L0GTF7_9GAMM|nr:hypothetical protein [Thioflavicoccus mobilis]AGA89092.1 hypothetical protein Thimo_0220 [Thioflavicoccus mobilis 8321]